MPAPSWQALSDVAEAPRQRSPLVVAEVSADGRLGRLVNPSGWPLETRLGDVLPPDVRRAMAALTDHAALLDVPWCGLAVAGVRRAGGGVVLFGARTAATFFQAVVERMPVVVLTMSRAGALRYANGALEALLGVPLSAVSGTSLWSHYVHPEDRWRLTQALRETAPVSIALRLRRPDGAVRLAECHFVPEGDDVSAVMLDLTEQSEVVAALHHSELLYNTFLEQSPVGLIHLDATGTVTFENHRFRQIVGEGPDDAWIGLPVAEVPGTDAVLHDAVARLLAGDSVSDCDVAYAPPAHPPRRLLVHGAPIRQEDGSLVGAVVMFQDVTAQRAQGDEVALRDRFARAEASLREAVLTASGEAGFLSEAARILGTTLGAHRLAFFLPDDEDPHRFVPRARWGTAPDAFARQSLTPGTTRDLDEAVRLHGAAVLPPRSTARERIAIPFYESGVLDGFVVAERDGPGRVTSRAADVATSDPSTSDSPHLLAGLRQRLAPDLVRVFETLRSWLLSTSRFRLTVAAIEDCLFTYALDLRGPRRYLLLTPQIAQMAGVPAATLLEHPGAWEALLDGPESQSAVAEHTARLGRGQDSEAVYRIRTPEGDVRTLRERATPQRTEGGPPRAAGILTDVTEQKAAEQALIDAKTAAEQSNRDKTAFIQMLSHELRTPLGALSGFAELLEAELADRADAGPSKTSPATEFAGTIREKARQTLALVTDLFDLTMPDAGAAPLARDAVPLDATARRVANRAFEAAVAALPPAERAAPPVTLDLDLAPAVAVGEAPRIEQVIEHLLSNAFKFTPGGTVRVATRREGDRAIVDVSDTGIGISDAYMERLFTPFVQEDQRLNRAYNGTGLGLALAKRLVDRMGGTVEVESEKGVGTTFTVSLPAAPGG